MTLIRKIVRRCVPERLRAPVLPRFGVPAFSQEGEDLILHRLLAIDHREGSGFYVDVGAHHPQKYSNTYFFYLKGWRGINIEARPGSKEEFDRERPNDINLELGIAREEGGLTYYEFDLPAYNGFCEASARKVDETGGGKIVGTKEIKTAPLASVLEEHLPNGQKIDFLTIDVEGLDLEVLRSNDWERFRPEVVVAEDNEFPGFARAGDSEVVKFLDGVGYELVGRAVNSLFFRTRSQKK